MGILSKHSEWFPPNRPGMGDLLLLSSWAGYFILFFLTEHLIPPECCSPVHCPLDDRIPFCEWFLIPYVSWYLLIAGSLLWFLVRDVASFRNLQIYILITQVIGLLCFCLLPSRQDLRPEAFSGNNLLTRLTGLLYKLDTNTGVCPSMHVAWSLGLISTWIRKNGIPSIWRFLITAWCLLICVSVSFVKQHSVLDILAAVPVCLAAEWFVFFRKGR